MTLKREIKDAYIENGHSVYIKTHSDAVYVDENETETLTQRLDNVKGSIAEHTSQLNNLTNNINSIASNLKTHEDDTIKHISAEERKLLNSLSEQIKSILNLLDIALSGTALTNENGNILTDENSKIIVM